MVQHPFGVLNRVGFFLFPAAAVSGIERKHPMKLIIKIKQQPDGSFLACCPSLPGCSAWGQTKEHVHSKISLAVRGYLARLDVCLPRELSRMLTDDRDDAARARPAIADFGLRIEETATAKKRKNRYEISLSVPLVVYGHGI